MTTDEKLAVQTVLIEECQRLAQEQPTLLVDALLQGNGPSLIHHVLSHQETVARRRADTLAHLLRAVTTEDRVAGGELSAQRVA